MPENQERVSRKRLTQLIIIESQRLATAASTNVKEHFLSHCHAFINRMFGVKRNAPPKSDVGARKAYFAKYRQAKKDLLAVPGEEVLTDDVALLEVINGVREHLPDGPFAKDSMAYDVHVRPQKYVPALIHMARTLIEAGQKAFQVLPLRLSNTPAYVTIDARALEEIGGLKVTDKMTYDNKVRMWDEYLEVVKTMVVDEGGLHLKMAPVFRRGKQSDPRYVFRGSICTDGLGVSIGLVRVDLRDLKGIDKQWRDATKASGAREARPLPYVDELDDPLAKLSGRSYAVIDPGGRDLHFVMHKDGKRMRYTRAARTRHSKLKRYNAIRKRLHTAAGALGGNTVPQWDNEMSKENSRAVEQEAFGRWIRVKMACLVATASHWQDDSFRRLKFNAKVNARRSEDMYAARIREKIGSPEECVLIVGDWSRGTGHLKGSPPSPRRGLLKVLRRHQYEMWLLKEPMTSARCSKCCDAHTKCEATEVKGKARHGLLRCKNVTCKQFHNRNANATRNMLRIVEAALEGKQRPAYLVVRGS